DAQIRFVRSNSTHHLSKSIPRKWSLKFCTDEAKSPRKQSLDQLLNLISRRKARLDVELRKLRLPILPQVFVAKATGNLVVRVEPRNHANLVEDLRTLW